MKTARLVLNIVFASLIAASTAYADAPPKRSRDFQGNYQTLVKNQHASPRIADCIATGYDLVKTSKIFDRLGFTEEDIGKAGTVRKMGKFSDKDQTRIASVISITGQARPRANSTNWTDITLRCGLMRGRIKAIEIRPTGK